MNKLLDLGCNTVIITLGKQGAIYASQKDRTVKKVLTATVQPMDTTVRFLLFSCSQYKKIDYRFANSLFICFEIF